MRPACLDDPNLGVPALSPVSHTPILRNASHGSGTLGAGKSQPTAQAVDQCSLAACRKPDFPLLHASLMDAFSDASCNKTIHTFMVLRAEGSTLSYTPSLTMASCSLFLVSDCSCYVIIIIILLTRPAQRPHLICAPRSHTVTPHRYCSHQQPCLPSGGSVSQPQPEPCSMRPRNLKKKTPPTSSPSRFQELIPDRLRLPIGCLVVTVAGITARTATPARFGVGSTRRGLGFLEIDATACRRSLAQHPRQKSFAAEQALVEKRVLGVSWVCVLGVLGCPGFQCWSRGRRARLTIQMTPHWQPLAPWPTDWTQGRTEGSSSPNLPQQR